MVRSALACVISPGICCAFPSDSPAPCPSSDGFSGALPLFSDALLLSPLSSGFSGTFESPPLLSPLSSGFSGALPFLSPLLLPLSLGFSGALPFPSPLLFPLSSGFSGALLSSPLSLGFSGAFPSGAAPMPPPTLNVTLFPSTLSTFAITVVETSSSSVPSV